MAQLKLDIVVDDNGAAQKLREVETALQGVEATSNKYVTALNASASATLGADSAYAQLEQRLRPAPTSWMSLAGATNDVVKSFMSLQGAIGGLTLAALVKDTIAFASHMDDLSERTGVGVVALQKMEVTGALVGVSIDQMVNAITQMQNRIEGGQSGAVNAIQRLGMSLEDIRDMNPEQQFNELSEAIGSVQDPAERTHLAMELFGRSGAKILATMTPEMRAFTAAAEDMGLIMSKSAITGGDAIDDFATLASKSLRKVISDFLHLEQLGQDIRMWASGNPEVSSPKGWKSMMPAATTNEMLSQRGDPTSSLWIGDMAAAESDINSQLKRSSASGRGRAAALSAKAAPWQMPMMPFAGALTGGLPGMVFPQGMTLANMQMPFNPYLTQLPGTNVGIPQAPPLPPKGFFGNAFGGTSGFGSGLGNILLQAFTGGGDIGKSLGGFLGGGVGGTLGKMGGGLGGMFGGLLGSVIPGLGTLLGGLGGSLFGKMFGGLFGPTKYETAEKERASGLQSVQSRVAGNEDQMRYNWAATGMGNDFDSVMKARDPKFISGLLDELQGKTERLTSAMQKYGITWEELGGKAKQAHVDMDAKDLIQDFDVLSAAGMNTDSIIQHMGSHINDFVQSAMRTGSTVPAAMKPMLDQMLKMGLLTDAAGNQLQDLSAVTFSDALPKTLQSIAEAIDHLAAALGYAGATASAAGGASVTPPPDTGGSPSTAEPGYTSPEPQDWQSSFRGGLGYSEYMHSGGPVGWRIAHRGGLGPDEFPLIGQAGEFMMSRRGVAANGIAVLNRMNQGQKVGGSGVTVNVNVSGSLVHQDELGEHITRLVAKTVRGNPRGAGTQFKASMGRR